MAVIGIEKRREKVLRLFLHASVLRFSEITRQLNWPSNLVSYFLTKMVKEGLLVRKKKGYSLSPQAEEQLPLLSQKPYPLVPLVVVLVMAYRGNELLLVKRDERPFQGFWSLPSGRLLAAESLEDACTRIMSEKYGSVVSFEHVCGTVLERLFSKKHFQHAFLFLVIKAKVESTKSYSNQQWFKRSKIPKRSTIASDYWMTQQLFDQTISITQETIQETSKATRMQLK